MFCDFFMAFYLWNVFSVVTLTVTDEKSRIRNRIRCHRYRSADPDRIDTKISRIWNPALVNAQDFLYLMGHTTPSLNIPRHYQPSFFTCLQKFFYRKNSQKMILKMKGIACTLMFMSACRMDSWSQSTARTFSWGKAVEIAMLKRKTACDKTFI